MSEEGQQGSGAEEKPPASSQEPVLPPANVQKMTVQTEAEKPPLTLLFSDMQQFVEDSPVIGTALSNMSQSLDIPVPVLSQTFLGVTGAYLVLGHGAELVAKLIGLAYPSYATVYSLINKNEKERKVSDSYWLRYWIVYAFVHLVSFLIDDIQEGVYGYWLLKAVIFFWLSMPPFHGAQRIYILTEKYIGLPYPQGQSFSLRTDFPEISDPKALPIPEGSVREASNPMPKVTGPPGATPGFRVWTDPNSGIRPPDRKLFPTSSRSKAETEGQQPPPAGFNLT